jgi:multicomponent Na+:H+ antiporter subunit E
MNALLTTFLPVFALYLWLTAGSGTVAGYWSVQELIAGFVLSLFASILARWHTGRATGWRILNPFRWLIGLAYVCGPFFFERALANLDVAYRVITGRIRPGIVRVKSGMKKDAGVLWLANSITLTPGTLSVSVDEDSNDLFVHQINIPEGEEKKETVEARDLFLVNCPAWIRRIAE